MNHHNAATLHDVSPEAALAAIYSHDGPVLLDLDETLYLSSSTEDFIDSAWPGALALLLMRMLDLLKPWRWTGGETTRDVWRVRLLLALFPWTGKRWRIRVKELASRFTNQRLINAVRSRSTPPIIATVGFQSIVEPLVAALGLPDARIVAARLSKFEDRRCGKLVLAVDALGSETVRTSLVVTDSSQDLPLLDACARPLRTVWPEARYRKALSGVYLPGQYLSQVKHPGERYIVRGILQEDFAFWVLSSIALAAFPLLHILGLLFLLVSFWAIYERGYVDNDLVAFLYEEKPKLSREFAAAPVATPIFAPWIWAAISGAIAVVLLRWPALAAPLDFAKWAAVLIATHACFHLYNRVDKATRVWMYPGLQFARSAAFVALVPISSVGAIAIGAHILSRWIPYYVYRFGATDWPKSPVYLTRLLFLLILASVLALAQGVSPFLNWTAFGLLAWNLFRARQEIKAVLMSMKWIKRKKDLSNRDGQRL